MSRNAVDLKLFQSQSLPLDWRVTGHLKCSWWRRWTSRYVPGSRDSLKERPMVEGSYVLEREEPWCVPEREGG
ncbi:hypothetical protein BgiBS90_031029 [Biomphalaria glabrata]|nr:hypothetical protein BgiBS90_031029 [Biomphalaria glabrata]